MVGKSSQTKGPNPIDHEQCSKITKRWKSKSKQLWKMVLVPETFVFMLFMTLINIPNSFQ